MCSFLEIDDQFLIGYRGGMRNSTEIREGKKEAFQNKSDTQTRNDCNLSLSLYASPLGCDDSRYFKNSGNQIRGFKQNYLYGLNDSVA